MSQSLLPNSRVAVIIKSGFLQRGVVSVLESLGAEVDVFEPSDSSNRRITSYYYFIVVAPDPDLPRSSFIDILLKWKLNRPERFIILASDYRDVSAFASFGPDFFSVHGTVKEFEDFITDIIYYKNDSVESSWYFKGLLSVREVEVLKLLAEGTTKAGVASRLNISPSTVEEHVRRIHSKFEVNSTVAAVTKGFRLGILK
jgi:DNA-binding CsgD family transcriptional regulator